MSLAIHNLSPTTLHLKLLERFERVKTERKVPGSYVSALAWISNVTRSLTHLMVHQSPTADELLEHAQSFDSKQVSVLIERFSAIATEIEPPGKNVLRLTFEGDGQRYRIDVPVTTAGTVTTTPLVQNPKHEFAAIYLQDANILTLFSSSKLNGWMSALKDETPITGLSIPGTHNSPTCYRALPSVRCQAVPPLEQMENGVRFLDLRVQLESPQDPSRDGLILVHSVFPISLTGTKYLRDLIKDVRRFLDKNPSETVIVSIKREGTGSATDAQLGHVLRSHYAGDVHEWFTAPHVPTLGEARGKIVLIRRFGLDEELRTEWDGKGWGIDASVWADNTSHALTPNGQICVQDFYEVLRTEDIEKKIQVSTEQLARAAATVTPLPSMGVQSERDLTEKPPLFINFLSASNFWNLDCWPEKIAGKLNPAVVEYLCRSHHKSAMDKQVGAGCTGIVICDWVGNNGDWNLVRAIVGMNGKLEIREEQA